MQAYNLNEREIIENIEFSYLPRINDLRRSGGKNEDVYL